jgi:hypothetical protein
MVLLNDCRRKGAAECAWVAMHYDTKLLVIVALVDVIAIIAVSTAGQKT